MKLRKFWAVGGSGKGGAPGEPPLNPPLHWSVCNSVYSHWNNLMHCQLQTMLIFHRVTDTTENNKDLSTTLLVGGNKKK